MSATSQVFAKLWQGKEKSKALLNGVFSFALPTTIPPGGRFSMFKIDHQGEKPKNAPDYELVFFADEPKTEGQGSGGGEGAGDGLSF